MSSFSNSLTAQLAGLFGVLLIAIIFIGDKYNPGYKRRDALYLRVCMSLTLVSCIVNAVVYTSDGRAGLVWLLINHIGSTWLFLSYTAIALATLLFICFHFNYHLPRAYMCALFIVADIMALLLVINFFTPVVFRIDENNVYSRLFTYNIFLLVDFFYLFNAISVYITVTFRKRKIKLFTMGYYLIPAIIGIIIEAVYYGISIGWACTAITFCGVYNGIQCEYMFRDRLTGVYNRSFLETLKLKIEKRKDFVFAGLMIDGNGMKKINDTFGHAEGDNAISVTAELIQRAVATDGIVIRYAGDEFIVLLVTDNSSKIQKCIDRIHKTAEEYNKHSGKPYNISMSIGHALLDGKNSIGEFMEEMDRQMYESKSKYYTTHDKYSRT